MSTEAAIPELTPEWRRAFDTVERLVGGKIVHAERQPRWRPAWFLDLERAGETVSVYFRGDRGEADHGVYPLEHEMHVLQVLEAHDIPVPHIYGFCEDPRGIVMSKEPGRYNLANAESEAEREAVLDDYVRILAEMHRIPVSAFEKVGLSVPATPEELALGDFDHWEHAFRGFKCRPEPLIEFGIRWVRRNIPKNPGQPAFLQGDAGQFLFDGGKVTTLLDFELGYVGDPAADLAGMRCRDLSEPLGDLKRAVRRYAELSGHELDYATLHYHTVRFGLNTPLCTSHLVARPSPEIDPIQYLAWYLVYARTPVEVMARLGGIELEDVALPEVDASRHAVAGDVLVEMLKPDAQTDASTAYRLDSASRVAEYLRRAERWGEAIEQEDLDEVATILGTRPASWNDADTALERFVLEAGPEHDAALIRYFYRRTLRHELLIEPVLRELRDTHMQLID
jgi:aminoglycoside phosphotransferase (APT) family kinase protein